MEKRESDRASAPAPAQIGEVLDGKYRVVSELGRGGFGIVFLARDKLAGRDVAIKVLRQADFADQSDLIWEIQQLAQLKIPQVLAFYHHFNAGGLLYLVMEYCDGGSLGDRLSRGKLDEVDAAQFVIQLAAAFDSVHASGIVHHDIKPENILFADLGVPRISDFGVANRHAGTLNYMAPELFVGEPVSTVDPRIDVYALTLTLMEMLTGERPFRNLARGDMLQAKITQSFVPKSLPAWLREVILRGTHPTPEARFQTMDELRQALIAKRVPMIMSGKRIQAHALAEKASDLLKKKRWVAARKALSQALRYEGECLLAIVTMGKLELALNNRDKATEFLLRASAISPRVPIQKELASLYLLEEDFPRAISLLTDYLDRNATDFEAHGLLMQCYFEMGRYDACDELGLVIAKQKPSNDSFECNRFVSRLLAGKIDGEFLAQHDPTRFPPFLRYNLVIAKEGPVAWSVSGKPTLKSKLLWHDFRFGNKASKQKQNELAIQISESYRYTTSKPIITIGQSAQNEVPLDDDSVSRRHAVILNWQDDVWVCDLDSTRGVFVDGKRIKKRCFLDGVHEIRLGKKTIRVSTSGGLLI